MTPTAPIAALPPELLPIMERLGPPLAVVHFRNLTPNHPIHRGPRGGNVAGRVSRGLVAAQAGFHLETVFNEHFRTHLYRVTKPEAAACMAAGIQRIGLARHAELFVFEPSAGQVRLVSYPLPARQRRAPAQPISHARWEANRGHAARHSLFAEYSGHLARVLKSVKHWISDAFVRPGVEIPRGAPDSPAIRHNAEPQTISGLAAQQSSSFT